MFRRTLVGGLALSAIYPSLADATNLGAPVAVDAAIALTVDVSFSVDEPQWQLQKIGYAETFTSETIIARIAAGREGRIAVCVVQWSSWDMQYLHLDWHLISDAASSHAVAEKIHTMPRISKGYTAIGAVLKFTATRFAREKMKFPSGQFFSTNRKVIDVSGDGADNTGQYSSLAYEANKLAPIREQVVRSGIIINGLPIVNKQPNIGEYYEQNVIGGAGSFSEIAQDFEDFPRAIRKKFFGEIA